MLLYACPHGLLALLCSILTPSPLFPFARSFVRMRLRRCDDDALFLSCKGRLANDVRRPRRRRALFLQLPSPTARATRARPPPRRALLPRRRRQRAGPSLRPRGLAPRRAAARPTLARRARPVGGTHPFVCIKSSNTTFTALLFFFLRAGSFAVFFLLLLHLLLLLLGVIAVRAPHSRPCLKIYIAQKASRQYC